MDSLLEVQKRLVPDLIEVMQKRFHILRLVGLMQPVGRRSLSQNLHMTERVLRSEIQFLKEQRLLTVTSAGMSLTKEGNLILAKLEDMMKEISVIPDLEVRLNRFFNGRECIVVPGNAEESSWVKLEMGRACLNRMETVLENGQIVAVTGGSTVAAVAEAVTPEFPVKDLLFVPARGGVGTDMQHQANTICEIMAKKTNSNYMVLYLPDQVSEGLYQSFAHDPSILGVLAKIKAADHVIHGIGDALTMARRRKTSEQDMRKITEGHAVAEAFGYYFDEEGKVVHRVKTVGLQWEDLQKVRHIFAVAGGPSKAKAIKAYMQIAPQNTILITDEAAADEILKG